MAMSLALLEGSSVFAALCGAMLAWLRPLPLSWIDVAAVLGQGLALSLCYTVAFYYTDLYGLRIVPSFSKFISRLPLSFGLALIPLAVLSTIFFKLEIQAGPFIQSLLIILALLLLIRAVFYWIMRSRLFVKRVVIVGTNPLAQKLITEIEDKPHFSYSIVGVVDDGLGSGKPPFGYPNLGPPEHLGKIVEEINPHRIIVAMTDRSRIPVRELLECRLRGITVEEGVEVYERLTGKLPIEWLTPSHLVFSKDFQKSAAGLAVARAISLLVSALALVCLSPVLGFIALAIKLDSRGAVFVVQSRVGRGGKPFRLIKFRTMHPIEGDTPLWFSDGANNRVTRVGKWLRKFRLDEFPQFVNVLNGDMNLVGPRPHREPKFKLLALVWRNAPECGQPIPYHSLRCLVPPGITGWAQVRYRYARDLEEETEKVRYDLYYLRHRSLWLDLLIILDTIKITFLGRGSATMPAYRPEPRQDRPQEELRRVA